MATQTYIIKAGDKYNPFTGQLLTPTQTVGTVLSSGTTSATPVTSTTSTPPSSSTTKITTEKDAIKELQTALNKQGANLVVDGIMGPLTQKALDTYNAQVKAGTITPTTSGTSPTSYTVQVGDKYNPFTGELLTATQKVGTVLSPATSPSTLGTFQPVPDANMPTNTPSYGDISMASSSIAGLQSYMDAIQKMNEDQRAMIEAQVNKSESGKQEKSWLSKLMSAPSIEEVRQNATEQTGIDPAQYFADQKKGIAEIESLTGEYNQVKAARDMQIAKTQDVLGSMNFINNQTAQIERNSAPKLNEISAQINSKAATLQALQGNFAEAQNFINQAVQDATADLKYDFDMYSMFKEINDETISKLEKPYEDALNTKIKIAEMAYEQGLSDKKTIGQMMIDPAYRGAGILITDTLDEAYKKANMVAGTNYTTDQNLIHGGSLTTGEVTKQVALTDLSFKTNINAMKADGATYEDVVQEIQMDNSISNKDRGIELAKQIYGVSNTTVTPEVGTSKSGGFLSNLFGGSKTTTTPTTTKQSYTPGSMISNATGSYNPATVSSFFTSLFE